MTAALVGSLPSQLSFLDGLAEALVWLEVAVAAAALAGVGDGDGTRVGPRPLEGWKGAQW